jgi:ceramide glucosyltransferase
MSLLVAALSLLGSIVMFAMLSRALRAFHVEVPPVGVLLPMTVIRPVRGLDPELEENARAALQVSYAAPLETLFVLDDASDPALPVIARVIAAEVLAGRARTASATREGVSARIVLAGVPPRGRTGKLHAMIRGLEEASATTPLVCFADSDTRPSPGLLEELARTMAASPDVGAVFARAITTHSPRTFGDVGYALLLDGLYGPQVVLASARSGSLPFVMGQTMVLRRSALDAVGGLEGSEGELVDDMHIGARLSAAGYRNVLSSPIAIVQTGLTFRELDATARRWVLFSRTGIPFWPFDLPTASWLALFFLGLVGGATSLARGDAASVAVFLGTSVSVVVSIQVLRGRQGGARLPLELWWAPFVCLAMVPAWFVRARFAKTVVWRGRRYALDADGRLSDPRRSLSDLGAPRGGTVGRWDATWSSRGRLP